MNKFRRVLAILAVGLCGALWLALPAGAQAWPPKTVRIIIPFPPGGTTDLIARRVQPMLERNLKTSILIENRGGASGAIGTHAAVAAAPDGATFVLVFDTHGANPSLLPNLPFDTLKDLAPVMLIGTSPMVITAHESTTYKSFADVIAAAKAQSGAVALRHDRRRQPRATRHEPDRQCARRDDDACAVQGRRSAGERRDRRACSGCHRLDRAALAAHQIRRAAGAGRHLRQARHATAGHADRQRAA